MTTNQYKLVPVEPTEEMMESAEQYLIDEGWESDSVGELNKHQLWDAMLAAAPVNPSADDEAQGWLWVLVHDKTSQVVNYGFTFYDTTGQHEKIPGFTYKVKPLYTTPQPSTDAAKGQCVCNTGEWQGNLCGICNGTGIIPEAYISPDAAAQLGDMENAIYKAKKDATK